MSCGDDPEANRTLSVLLLWIQTERAPVKGETIGDNPEADMALKEDPKTPDAGQSDPAGPDLRVALMGEMALFIHSALTGRDYDANRMVPIATTLQREKTRELGTSSAQTNSNNRRHPAGLCSPFDGSAFCGTTAAAASSPTCALVSAERYTPAAVASTPIFQSFLSGDSHILLQPEPTSVPPPPCPVLDEIRRALHAVREEEESEATQHSTRKPIIKPIINATFSSRRILSARAAWN
eukprot:6203595-Pleurochrysis_carterae.AAC.2